MSEYAPTDIQARLEAMNAAITAEEQAKKDAKREEAWLGFSSEEKTTLGPHQKKTVEDMAGYVQSRPEAVAEESEETSTEEKFSKELAQRIDHINVPGEAYEPMFDMDKELAHLSEIFAKSDEPEHIAAALDQLSDFCEIYELSRAQEKALRTSLLLDKDTQSTPKSDHEASAEAAASEGDQAKTANTEEKAAESDNADTTEEQSESSEKQTEAPVFNKGDKVTFLNLNNVLTNGEVSSYEEDPNDASRIRYIVNYQANGQTVQVSAHQEDLKMTDDDKAEAAPSDANSGPSVGVDSASAPKEPVDSAEPPQIPTEEEPTSTEDDKEDDENKTGTTDSSSTDKNGTESRIGEVTKEKFRRIKGYITKKYREATAEAKSAYKDDRLVRAAGIIGIGGTFGAAGAYIYSAIDGYGLRDNPDMMEPVTPLSVSKINNYKEYYLKEIKGKSLKVQEESKNPAKGVNARANDPITRLKTKGKNSTWYKEAKKRYQAVGAKPRTA